MIIRLIYCVWPAIVFACPLATIGCPIILCLIAASAVFGLGWQITTSHFDEIHSIKLEK